jgi:membrane-associated phospholipid phosphatase
VTTTARTAHPISLTIAQILTEILAPIVLIVGLLFAVAIHASSTAWRGVLYGFVAAFFAGGLPYAIMMLGIRRGHLGDRHLSERAERPVMMVIGLISVTVGLLITWRLGAPRALFALVAAMVAGVAVALAITVFWKISIHTASAAGTVAILVIEFGPALWATLPIVAAVAWARVALRDHTPAQVTAGTLVGFAVAATVMSLVR